MITKRRLAYIIHDVAVGGAEVAFLSALPKLHETFNLKVYVLGSAKPTLMAGLAEPVQKRTVCFNMPAWALPLYMPVIYLRLRSFNPDIIISSLWRSTVPAMLYKFWHGHARYFVMLHSNGFFHWADRFFTSRAIRMSNAVFADSLATKAFAQTIHGAKSPVKALSYLVNPIPRHPRGYDFSGTKKFCFMGKLNKIKRVSLAVSAIAWLRAHEIDATLDIFGRDEGEQAAVMEQIQLAGMQEYIRINGEVSPAKKDEIHDSHNFYIQLSIQEGMAMSVAEAMQHGMVCVVTAVGEIPNYAKDGQSAIFMDTRTPESWEAAMNKLLLIIQDEEKCSSISKAAHETFRNTPIFSDSLIDAITNS
ncbi:glycosyltransferase family 4 protein [Parapedobacter tibetensis]|uniref:glycosyltransferase family 4 protein n=1 Tax=Parapedobacter tibetensis TaxID=2972951 RepID=UPI00214D5762|nr:glycosyltransferase family 4 protein [Parapedobacter tibetensis]